MPKASLTENRQGRPIVVFMERQLSPEGKSVFIIPFCTTIVGIIYANGMSSPRNDDHTMFFVVIFLSWFLPYIICRTLYRWRWVSCEVTYTDVGNKQKQKIQFKEIKRYVSEELDERIDEMFLIFANADDNTSGKAWFREKVKGFVLEEGRDKSLSSRDRIFVDLGEGETYLLTEEWGDTEGMRRLRAMLHRAFISRQPTSARSSDQKQVASQRYTDDDVV